jgi:hypothetical protein
VITEV